MLMQSEALRQEIKCQRKKKRILGEMTPDSMDSKD